MRGRQKRFEDGLDASADRVPSVSEFWSCVLTFLRFTRSPFTVRFPIASAAVGRLARASWLKKKSTEPVAYRTYVRYN